MAFKITPEQLQESARTYSQELLIMPVISAEDTLKHMRGILNLKGPVMLGELDGDAELAPYKATRGEDGNFNITGRELAPQLGNCAKHFDPNQMYNSIYGNNIFKGEDLKNVDIAKSILLLAAAKIGKALNYAIWTGVRNPGGDKTIDLFDGFNTIIGKEISGGAVAARKHNYVDVAKITSANAVDIIEQIVDGMSPELQRQHVKMYLPVDIYKAYQRDYRERFGQVAYNREFKKAFVEGTDDLVEFCPLASMTGSEYIWVSPESNMVYGAGGGEYPGETVGIGKYSSWKLTLEEAMAFGVQIESIAPEKLLVAKMASM